MLLTSGIVLALFWLVYSFPKPIDEVEAAKRFRKYTVNILWRKEHVCTGLYIGPDTVLTVEDCCYSEIKQYNEYSAVMGSKFADGRNGQTRKVTAVHGFHNGRPNVSRILYLGLVRISRPFVSGPNVQIIKINRDPTEGYRFCYIIGYYMGWLSNRTISSDEQILIAKVGYAYRYRACYDETISFEEFLEYGSCLHINYNEEIKPTPWDAPVNSPIVCGVYDNAYGVGVSQKYTGETFEVDEEESGPILVAPVHYVTDWILKYLSRSQYNTTRNTGNSLHALKLRTTILVTTICTVIL